LIEASPYALTPIARARARLERTIAAHQPIGWQERRLMRSLADRLRAYEQQKARLVETEAKLKDAEKKARSRRLIEIGGLAEKAGLAEIPTAQLYGALLSLRGNMDNPKQLEQWATTGSRAMIEEGAARDENREPIVLTLPAKPVKEATALLRSSGFRYNNVFRHWEGFAQFETAEQLAAELGGEARRISSIPPVTQAHPSPSTTEPAARDPKAQSERAE
jgi:hypothetical protein